MNISAFPIQSVYIEDEATNSRGMTLRDYFAAKAMLGIISDPDTQMNYEEIATRAYQYADAMMEVKEA